MEMVSPPTLGDALLVMPSAPARQTGITLYRRDVGHGDLLSAEDEQRLALSIERGRAAAKQPKLPANKELIETGKQAEHQLIEANLRLVLHVARRYRDIVEIDLLDLI